MTPRLPATRIMAANRRRAINEDFMSLLHGGQTTRSPSPESLANAAVELAERNRANSHCVELAKNSALPLRRSRPYDTVIETLPKTRTFACIPVSKSHFCEPTSPLESATAPVSKNGPTCTRNNPLL